MIPIDHNSLNPRLAASQCVAVCAQDLQAAKAWQSTLHEACWTNTLTIAASSPRLGEFAGLEDALIVVIRPSASFLATLVRELFSRGVSANQLVLVQAANQQEPTDHLAEAFGLTICKLAPWVAPASANRTGFHPDLRASAKHGADLSAALEARYQGCARAILEAEVSSFRTTAAASLLHRVTGQETWQAMECMSLAMTIVNLQTSRWSSRRVVIRTAMYAQIIHMESPDEIMRASPRLWDIQMTLRYLGALHASQLLQIPCQVEANVESWSVFAAQQLICDPNTCMDVLTKLSANMSELPRQALLIAVAQALLHVSRWRAHAAS